MFVSKPDCFANKHTNDKLKYWVCSDSGAAISVMNNKCLFDNDKFTNVGSVKDRSEKGVLGQVADYGTQKGRQRTKKQESVEKLIGFVASISTRSAGVNMHGQQWPM